MNKWIDVEIQIPNHEGRYLCYNFNVFIARYVPSANKWEREDCNIGIPQKVSHWMPLPEAANN